MPRPEGAGGGKSPRKRRILVNRESTLQKRNIGDPGVGGEMDLVVRGHFERDRYCKWLDVN